MAEVKCVRPTTGRQTLWWKKKASTAFPYKSLVTADEDETATAGTFDVATSSTERVLGVTGFVTVSTDADYALTPRKPVYMDPLAEWEMAVGTGTADANDAGGYIDLKDADEVDVTASTIDAFFVSRFISAAKVRGYIVRWHFNEAPATN